jgi:hypothetical protein
MSADDRANDDIYAAGFEAADGITPSDTLTGDNTDDPVDAGFSPPERASHSWRGETAEEASEGESLDQHLAEEEPEVWDNDTDDVDAEPRAGRLVAPDEGAHERTEADEVAQDVGPAGYASSAEEAAIHVIDDDRDI